MKMTKKSKLARKMQQVEHDIICTILEKAKGSIRKAAELLNEQERTLWAKIHRLGINPAEFREEQ